MDIFLDDSNEEQLYYVSAQDAASFLSKLHKRIISTQSMCKLAKRKKQPIRTRSIGRWLFYCLEDLEQVTIKNRGNSINQREDACRADAN